MSKDNIEEDIIVKSVVGERPVFPLAHEPYVDLGKPFYYIVLEMPKSKRTIDIHISREEYLKLINFMSGLEVKA
ncbi:MAG: hypothetical protein DRN17_00045 [Thermoplasmata archaeon]|nr:MAG: hypothetical protein DRN17_00045 [Thermoplasmata archaeon]